MSAIKGEPRKYVFGTSAVGSASHLAQETIKYDGKLEFMIALHIRKQRCVRDRLTFPRLNAKPGP